MLVYTFSENSSRYLWLFVFNLVRYSFNNHFRGGFKTKLIHRTIPKFFDYVTINIFYLLLILIYLVIKYISENQGHHFSFFYCWCQNFCQPFKTI